MSELSLFYPVGTAWTVSQTYDQHIQRAKQHGWCWKPGVCPGGTYYYGGIDWACPNGTPIYATMEGVVSKVVTNAGVGYGWAVYILHPNGYTSIYGHMGVNEIKVGVGDRLEAGSILGYSDNTGNSTGPHIHFEFRDKTGLAIDAMPYLTTHPVIIPPPVEPPVLPPVIPPTSKIVTPLTAVNVRTAPAVLAVNAIGLLHPGRTIESTGETVEAGGRKWLKCIVYIASEFLGGV